MKRNWTIVVVVSLLLGAVSVLSVRVLRGVPADECSEVYRRYADREDIAASYIRDYKVNDSVTVPVTTLNALTDDGWSVICDEFNIKPIPEEISNLIDTNAPVIRLAPKNNYSSPKDSLLLNNDVIAISRCERQVFVFCLTVEEQVSNIVGYYVNKNPLAELNNKRIVNK